MIGRKVLTGLIYVVAWVGITCGAYGQEPPQEVIFAANEGLPSFIAKIPKEASDIYGISKADSVSEISLGSPFKLYKIAPAAFSAYKQGDGINSLISETSMWYFPVLRRGETKAFLVVGKVNDSWAAVSLGYKSLAQELKGVQQQWSGKAGYHPRLIAVFQAQEYLFTIPEKDASNLTVIGSGRSYDKLDQLPAAVERLKPVVQKNLEQQQ